MAGDDEVMAGPPRRNASILARLKEETRPEHDAIEGTLELMRDDLTREAYCRCLGRFYGFHVPVEERLTRLGEWHQYAINLVSRRKSPLIETDLRALDAPDVENLPICRELPELVDMADGFGCMYVLEGSTLGGQFISRHVRSVLGVTPESGGRFFYGYGERTGELWRQFGAALTACADDRDTQDRVVAAAIATFRTFRRWFREGNSA